MARNLPTLQNVILPVHKHLATLQYTLQFTLDKLFKEAPHGEMSHPSRPNTSAPGGFRGSSAGALSASRGRRTAQNGLGVHTSVQRNRMGFTWKNTWVQDGSSIVVVFVNLSSNKFGKIWKETRQVWLDSEIPCEDPRTGAQQPSLSGCGESGSIPRYRGKV